MKNKILKVLAGILVLSLFAGCGENTKKTSPVSTKEKETKTEVSTEYNVDSETTLEATSETAITEPLYDGSNISYDYLESLGDEIFDNRVIYNGGYYVKIPQFDDWHDFKDMWDDMSNLYMGYGYKGDEEKVMVISIPDGAASVTNYSDALDAEAVSGEYNYEPISFTTIETNLGETGIKVIKSWGKNYETNEIDYTQTIKAFAIIKDRPDDDYGRILEISVNNFSSLEELESEIGNFEEFVKDLFSKFVIGFVDR